MQNQNQENIIHLLGDSMIEKVTQVVDTKGKLKTKKCPKCKMDAMYFNFNGILICRNCSYMPSCPTCKRHYQMDNYFKGEKGNIEHMQKPPEYENTKHALSYLVGQLAGLLLLFLPLFYFFNL
jgi:ribosomal protein L37AE/L43A